MIILKKKATLEKTAILKRRHLKRTILKRTNLKEDSSETDQVWSTGFSQPGLVDPVNQVQSTRSKSEPGGMWA